jgi:Flp pilus assembly protein TadD
MIKMKICVLALAAVVWAVPNGMANAQQGALEENTAIELAPVSESVSQGLRFFYQGDFSTAVARFSAAIQANPDDTGARYYLGYTYYQLDEFAQSRAAFQEAYSRDPSFTPVAPATVSMAAAP